MAQTLKETLKEIQILLGTPHKRIAGALKYYLNFLNVPETIGKRVKTAPGKVSIQEVQHAKITWVDVANPTRREISKLAQDYPFHPLHLEDCVSKGQFPKIEQNDEDNYIFLLLRFPRLDKGQDSITTSQICFFLGEKYLVSIHDGNETILDIFADCRENLEQRKAYIDNASAHLLYTIINRLTDDLSYLLQKITAEVDETEDIVFDDKVSGVYKIGQLRRKILIARRAISPLRSLLQSLALKVNKFSKANLSVYFDNIIDQIDKAWGILEEARDTVDIYKDADFTISTEKTSRILAVLTIIFTLTIPATAIGTLYGMNILLPGGLEAGSWDFLGRYTTFIVILIAAILPAALMYLYFRGKGWS